MTDDTKDVFEVFIAVDEDGNFEVGTSDEEAYTRLTENYTCYQVRLGVVAVHMNRPKLLSTEVEVEDDETELRAVEQEEEEPKVLTEEEPKK